MNYNKSNHSHEPQLDFSEEVWKPVSMFNGIYDISSMGRIRRSSLAPESNSTYRGRILAPNVDKYTGYARVTLHAKGKVIRQQLHRLVALEFLDGFEPNRHVNHKNGIKNDNRVVNLEWVTPRENVLHAWRTGLCTSNKGENHGASKLTERESKAVMVLLASGVQGRLIASAFGIAESAISSMKRGKNWKHLKNL